MKMYRARNGQIREYEIVKKTVKSVFIAAGEVWNRETKELIESSGSKWCDTWDEAKQFLVELAESKCASLRRQLESANGQLGNVKGLKRG